MKGGTTGLKAFYKPGVQFCTSHLSIHIMKIVFTFISNKKIDKEENRTHTGSSIEEFKWETSYKGIRRIKKPE